MSFMNSFLRSVYRKLFHPLRIAILLAALAMTVVSAPFDSGGAFDPPALIGFWAVCLTVGVALAVLVETAAENWLGGLGLLPRRIIETLVFGLLLSGFVRGVVVMTYPPELAKPASLWLLFLVLGGVYGFISLAKVLVHPTKGIEEEPAFLKRLPQSLGKAVNWVSSSDHYIVVSTDMGTETILMRFSDAVAELDSLDGVRVHRSHWVSRDAVKGQDTSNGKTLLLLKDGTKIPVSRSYREAAEKAGVL